MSQPGCQCGHERDRHFGGTGMCWEPSCPCTRFQRWKKPAARGSGLGRRTAIPSGKPHRGRRKPKDREAIRRRQAREDQTQGDDQSQEYSWGKQRRKAFLARVGDTDPSCEVCGRPVRDGCEVAHFHPLGSGRSREDPLEYCERCDVWLNSIENLRIVCLSLRAWPAGQKRSCHAEIDRQFAESGGCTRERRNGQGDEDH